MKLSVYSYRYAQEILEHPNNVGAWNEIKSVLQEAPVFIYPGKSTKSKKLKIVQQLMNTYFDRRFAVDLGWKYHPLATAIKNSNLAADFQKQFGNLTIQAEIQFGNMARWYSDIFKLQAAYSNSLIQLGLLVVPMAEMAKVTDSNVAQFERASRELPAANLSITLPIMLVGLEQDAHTPEVDVRECAFASLKDIVGKGNTENRWRIINGYLAGVPMKDIGPHSPTGPMLETAPEEEEEEASGSAP
ncbi:restriction endonuclease BglII [Dongia mobilis]|uniref:Restriction endonuclease BglII n=1 Tax=Dongia mobilis TaxID=578943 RepID=A0A4R6WM14_9PROT|nr:BglII/BstYI family type II restriction endonuclease [Dongia mobilis]TDQ82019.1 restriction endonuclease BglII [Dongia mobilis]